MGPGEGLLKASHLIHLQDPSNASCPPPQEETEALGAILVLFPTETFSSGFLTTQQLSRYSRASSA